jgi:hypothetical protein
MARTRKYYLKKQLFDLEVKGQGPTKVIMVFETPPYAENDGIWVFRFLFFATMSTFISMTVP